MMPGKTANATINRESFDAENHFKPEVIFITSKHHEIVVNRAIASWLNR